MRGGHTHIHTHTHRLSTLKFAKSILILQTIQKNAVLDNSVPNVLPLTPEPPEDIKTHDNNSLKIGNDDDDSLKIGNDDDDGLKIGNDDDCFKTYNDDDGLKIGDDNDDNGLKLKQPMILTVLK